MKIFFNNLGKIKTGEVCINKNLLVFTGPNNSGKTYVSYCLYGLSRNFPSAISDEMLTSVFSDILDDIFDLGVIEIDLNEIFTKENIELVLSEFSKEFKKFLPRLFGTESDLFQNSDIKFSLEEEVNIPELVSNYRFGIASSGHTGGIVVRYKKMQNKLNVSLVINSTSGEVTPQIKKSVLFAIQKNLLQYSFNAWSLSNPFFITAERIGISVFSKDLFTDRFTRTNEILSLDESNRSRIVQLFAQGFNTYSLVIQDSLRIQENLGRFSKRQSGWEEAKFLADELENKILGGNVLLNAEGDVIFSSDNTTLKIQTTGSIVKSLSSFVFYLRNYAYKGQTLIFDEPEINLHPDNQILVARILAELANIGVRVIVSTHSDYFIREFNNLIMLSKETPDRDKLLDKYNYKRSQILDKSSVGVYFFKDGTIKDLKIEETGFEIPTIDDAINSQNSSTNEIRWTLFE